MKKFLTVLGGIVLGVAAIAGTVYAVLYFLKKDENCDDCCYIDDDDDCCDDDEAEEETEESDGECCCHGEEEAEKALAAAKALFISGGASADMPTTELSDDNFTDGKVALLDMLVLAKLAPSKGEARRLVQQGGILVGDDKVTDLYLSFDKSAFENGLIVKKGKKTYHKFTVK